MSVSLCIITMSLSMFYRNILTSVFSLFLSLEISKQKCLLDHKVVILQF